MCAFLILGSEQNVAGLFLKETLSDCPEYVSVSRLFLSVCWAVAPGFCFIWNRA